MQQVEASDTTGKPQEQWPRSRQLDCHGHAGNRSQEMRVASYDYNQRKLQVPAEPDALMPHFPRELACTHSLLCAEHAANVERYSRMPQLCRQRKREVYCDAG